MSWLRADDSLDSHPKILALKTDQKRWTWLRVLLYTTRYQTSIIPVQITETIPKATPQFLQECAQLGLVDHENDGTMRVHDWQEYNGQLADQRDRWRTQKRTQRGQQGGQTADNQVDNGRTPEDLARTRAGAVPIPSPKEKEKAVTHYEGTAQDFTNEQNLEHILKDIPF